ncbi:F-box/kelch-repeat protein At3g23880-like [Vicia villosa]|uniref:F-box/kelch-repeat protein At3g23880-like n=1 Tax=Vicia villosa TaxID=3911 RepID=UPI00273C22B1|nr:F-box/kelch-repeat protein At3g23880-like [Vicia villosa]
MKKSLVVTNDDKVSNYVNDDVALSILSKLSFKSLKRFECVRKSWSLLSDNPTFMSMYRRNFFSKCSYDDDTSLILHIHGQKKLHSLSGEGFENMAELDLPDQIDHLNFLGFGCVNGILCFEEPLWNKTVLWNPTTNELKVIRSSPFQSFTPPATLNFEAAVRYSTIPNLHGFGYDCVGDDYKLIRYASIRPKFHTFQPSHRDLKLARDKSLKPFWEIYSLKNNSWKKLEIDMPSCTKYNSGFGTFRVYLDGACHWLNLDKENNYIGASLISFDLSNEVFISTPIPSFVGEPCTGLLVLNGSIALFTYHENMSCFNISTFDISVLGELGVKESWYKLFTVGPLPFFKSPIGVGKKGEIFFRKNDSELVWFDFNTNTIKHLGFKAGRDKRRGNCFGRIVIYNKSMLSIGAKSN